MCELRKPLAKERLLSGIAWITHTHVYDDYDDYDDYYDEDKNLEADSEGEREGDEDKGEGENCESPTTNLCSITQI